VEDGGEGVDGEAEGLNLHTWKRQKKYDQSSRMGHGGRKSREKA